MDRAVSRSAVQQLGTLSAPFVTSLHHRHHPVSVAISKLNFFAGRMALTLRSTFVIVYYKNGRTQITLLTYLLTYMHHNDSTFFWTPRFTLWLDSWTPAWCRIDDSDHTWCFVHKSGAYSIWYVFGELKKVGLGRINIRYIIKHPQSAGTCIKHLENV